MILKEAVGCLRHKAYIIIKFINHHECKKSELWCFQPVNYSFFLDAFQQKFSSCVGICVLESLYECMQRCRSSVVVTAFTQLW